jgi:hypothetical protein
VTNSSHCHKIGPERIPGTVCSEVAIALIQGGARRRNGVRARREESLPRRNGFHLIAREQGQLQPGIVQCRKHPGITGALGRLGEGVNGALQMPGESGAVDH